MLTSGFRAFGGEELVRDFLQDLPGGFWTQFIVVMAVIFLLGFFLDFIEIAVVVVPIIAPILLAETGANVSAIWLGVMIGVNLQTSFLTPPFGFALFYLKGVAPSICYYFKYLERCCSFYSITINWTWNCRFLSKFSKLFTCKNIFNISCSATSNES